MLWGSRTSAPGHATRWMLLAFLPSPHMHASPGRVGHLSTSMCNWCSNAKGAERAAACVASGGSGQPRAAVDALEQRVVVGVVEAAAGVHGVVDRVGLVALLEGAHPEVVRAS